MADTIAVYAGIETSQSFKFELIGIDLRIDKFLGGKCS
jgi:hypothetical protein